MSLKGGKKDVSTQFNIGGSAQNYIDTGEKAGNYKAPCGGIRPCEQRFGGSAEFLHRTGRLLHPAHRRTGELGAGGHLR